MVALKDNSEKFSVVEEIDPAEWVIEAAEGEENVRAFMLGWNCNIDLRNDLDGEEDE